MYCSFESRRSEFVVETVWSGALTGPIIAAGVVERMNWIKEHTTRTPLVLLSDYMDADLALVTTQDLRMIAALFRGIDLVFPNVHWVSVMSEDLKFGIARQWQVYAESIIDKTHVVRTREEAFEMIDEIISNATCND